MNECDEEYHERGGESPRHVYGGTGGVGRRRRHKRAGQTIGIPLARLEQLFRVVPGHVEVREHGDVAVRIGVVDVGRKGARKIHKRLTAHSQVRVRSVAHTGHHGVVLGGEVYWACCTTPKSSQVTHCTKLVKTSKS